MSSENGEWCYLLPDGSEVLKETENEELLKKAWTDFISPITQKMGLVLVGKLPELSFCSSSSILQILLRDTELCTHHYFLAPHIRKINQSFCGNQWGSWDPASVDKSLIVQNKR